MAFGFDAGIILGQRRPDTMGAARTMADLLGQRQAMGIRGEQHQQTLASLLRDQEQQRALQGIYAQNAANPDGMGEALAGAGFGAEALAWLKQGAAARAAQAQQDLAERRLKEIQRHNLEQEKRPSGMPPFMVLPGADGTYHFVNPRNPQAPAAPVTDEAGKPLGKPMPSKAAKPLNLGDRDRLQALHGQARAADDLLSKFKDDYAGMGPVGGAVVSGGQMLGSWAPETVRARGEFWADFGKMVDLPERNATFGASLTEGEKRAWENAKNIKPGAPAKVVREQLEKMRKIAQDAARRRGRSLAKDGYSADAIEEFTGPLGLGPAAPAAAPSAPGAVLFTDKDAAELAALQAEGF